MERKDAFFHNTKKIKRMKLMFLITKDEAAELLKRYPTAFLTICSKRKRSGGKTYWCAENAAYHRFIEELRKNENIE